LHAPAARGTLPAAWRKLASSHESLDGRSKRRRRLRRPAAGKPAV